MANFLTSSIGKKFIQSVSGAFLVIFLLLHGTADQTVPCAQMEVFYRRLKAAGADVTACYVDGAEHGGNFWGPEMRSVIHDHLCRWLQRAEKE